MSILNAIKSAAAAIKNKIVPQTKRTAATTVTSVSNALPRGVEGNRIMLAQLSTRLSFYAEMSKLRREHRKDVVTFARKIGKTTLPWAIRLGLNV